MKGQAMVDHLVDLPLLEYQPLEMQFPDDDVQFAMEGHRSEDPKVKSWWKLHFDSAVNKKGMGICNIRVCLVLVGIFSTHI